MKKLIAVSFVALMASSNVMAEMSPKMYVGAGLGLTTNTTLTIDADGIKSSMNDPVLNTSLMFGAELNKMFRVEAELNYNGTHEYAENSDTDTEYDRTSFMANAFFTAPIDSAIKPYLGLGLGYADQSFYWKEKSTGDSETLESSNFAYQGMIGAEYSLNDKLNVGIEYKYFMADFDLPSGGAMDVSSQSVTAKVRYSF